MGLIRWLQRAKEEKIKRLCFTAGLTALVYWIWACRNSIIWKEEYIAKEEVVRRVKKAVKERLIVLGSKTRDMVYVVNLMTCTWDESTY